MKVIMPTVLGNILEWYDFALYGYFAATIARLFFPANDPVTALLKTFGVFAIGFLARPLGAILFGHWGDRLGRKKTLAITVILMAISTTTMGLLPTYKTIGIWGGVFLTLCRLLQGLAGGGEFAGSIVYLVEHAPNKLRGFYGGWTLFGATGGFVVASAVAAIINNWPIGKLNMDIAWRFAFLLSIVLGIVGLYLRLRMPETPNFIALSASKNKLRYPLIYALRNNWSKMLQALGLVFAPTACFYLLFVYLPSYLQLYLKFPLHDSLAINAFCMIILICIEVAAGYASDCIGRKPVFIISTIIVGALIIPLFLLLQHATLATVLSAQIIFAIITGFSFGAVPATLVEMFATNVRYTAVAIPQNIATILGGTSPLVATFLIHYFNTTTAPAFYLIFAIVLSVIAVLCLQETYRKDLQ